MVPSLKGGTRHPWWERNTVSAQILKRNHKLSPKVLSPEYLEYKKLKVS